MFRFPWGNMHSLNLGWFLQKFNELREDWATAEAGIDGALDAEIQRAEDALSDVFDARDAAAASATAAAGSASAANTSKTAAQNSATAAASSATLANNKATAAGLSEAAAAQSATAASNSATASATSATQAGQSAAAAQNSAAAAAASEQHVEETIEDATSEAIASATQTATTAATNAANSATAAGNSATAAAGSATAAADSATAAAGSATAAADSATAAAASAAEAQAVEESIPEDYLTLSAHVSELQTAVTQMELYQLKDIEKHYGNLSTTKTWNNINANYQHIVIPISAGDNISLTAMQGTNCQYAIVTDYVTPTNGASVPYSADTNYNNRKTLTSGTNQTFSAPSDAKFLILMAIYSGDECLPIYASINNYEYTSSAKTNIEHALNQNPVKWLVMGDSIAFGYYSAFEEGAGVYHINQNETWTTLMANIKRWKKANIAIGGTGYYYHGPSGTAQNAFELAAVTDFTPYDIVTLSYGVNDWKGNVPTGTLNDDISNPTTTIASMRKTIETILTSNPNIKIVVITPLNCRGYELSYGDFNSNYALEGQSFSNSGTLQDFFEAIISVCNFYGIQYIDETHYSGVNRKNIVTALPDGVHPSLEIHKVIAHEIAEKIGFM